MIAQTLLSAVVPVTERLDPVADVYRAYRKSLEAVGLPYEIIFVLDGPFPRERALLEQLKAEAGGALKIITLSQPFGESTALSVGFDSAAGDVILTLPAYLQVDPDELPRLVRALDGADMVVGRRWPRKDSALNRIQSTAFNALVRSLLKVPFHDLGCGVRVFRRKVMEEVQIYGDYHRFLPLLAAAQGFRVEELDVRQSTLDQHRRLYAPGTYVRRLFDILSIYFLIKFTRKPLRFFGLVGATIFAVGLLISVYVVLERLVLGVSLAERPLFVVGCLGMVLGVQIIAVGLVGEIVIFTHAGEIKDYKIEKTIN